jgi:hypothetical protein
MNDFPCWCDARCHGVCSCLFHGNPDDLTAYDCGSPRTLASIYEVAADMAGKGQLDGSPEAAALAALDWLSERAAS